MSMKKNGCSAYPIPNLIQHRKFLGCGEDITWPNKYPRDRFWRQEHPVYVPGIWLVYYNIASSTACVGRGGEWNIPELRGETPKFQFRYNATFLDRNNEGNVTKSWDFNIFGKFWFYVLYRLRYKGVNIPKQSTDLQIIPSCSDLSL